MSSYPSNAWLEQYLARFQLPSQEPYSVGRSTSTVRETLHELPRASLVLQASLPQLRFGPQDLASLTTLIPPADHSPFTLPPSMYHPRLLPSQQPPRRPLLTPSKRGIFIVFIKILFRCLEKMEEHNLCRLAKAIVSNCTRRNRLGDSKYTPLQDSVEQRLRGVVGEVHWKKAQALCVKYCRKHVVVLP